MMGDGRYYTPEQFFNVVLFTVLIIIMTIVFMLCFYTVDRYKKWILTVFGFLDLSLLAAFIAEVAYKENVVDRLHVMGGLFLFSYIVISLGFYIYYFMKSKEKPHMAITFILFCLPSIIYLLKPEFVNIIYIPLVANSIVLLKRFAMYRVSSSVFSYAKELVLDYVFIIGINGDLIFSSDKVGSSSLFKKMSKIDVDNIESAFYDKVIIRKAFGKQFIKLDGEKLFYFQYQIKEIKDKGKVLGYILTFTDITDLIAMLDELSNKREEISAKNAELMKYKDIVYAIEREKEIGTLMDEIAGTQQRAMLELKDEIENLDIYDEKFVSKIDELIVEAKADLKDVRDIVTAYVSYYD